MACGRVRGEVDSVDGVERRREFKFEDEDDDEYEDEGVAGTVMLLYCGRKDLE
jgi:hypothetical protein